LIADDDPGVRATLQNILTERGLTVDLAVDGEAAVSLLATHHYDLMFCGVRLPKMGGLALYTRISDDYGELAGHFAFIASQHLDAESLAIMERGRVPVLARPLSVADVDETIGRLRAAPLV
jgi:two-component system response regulator MprA